MFRHASALAFTSILFQRPFFIARITKLVLTPAHHTVRLFCRPFNQKIAMWTCPHLSAALDLMSQFSIISSILKVFHVNLRNKREMLDIFRYFKLNACHAKVVHSLALKAVALQALFAGEIIMTRFVGEHVVAVCRETFHHLCWSTSIIAITLI